MSELSAKIAAQADEDARNGFVAGRYMAIDFTNARGERSWVVTRVDDLGRPVGGMLPMAGPQAARNKASELNARSTAMLAHEREAH